MSLNWAYGTPPSEEYGAELLNRALDLGYEHLDTAGIYGAGKNEELIAKALAGRRQEYFLATKMGIVADGPRRSVDCSPAAIRKAIDESLRRLQTDHVDLYYLHRFDPKVPIADMIGTMADLVAAGKIGGIGVSEWSSDHIRAAHAVHPLAAVQTEYSPWTRNPELGVLDACRELGIAFVAFSPLGRGVFAGGVQDPKALQEADLRRNMPRFSEDNWPSNLRLVEVFEQMAQELSVTPAQLCLAWLLGRGDFIHAIPGTTQIDHLAENFALRDWTIPDDVTGRIDALINQQTVSGHRYAEGVRPTIDTEDYR
jgi:aryl-alcohol dehydrogenase-like predicted oxidoreductase